jgi:hypothetical protein
VPLGKWSQWLSLIKSVSKGNLTRQDRHFVGFSRLLSDVKEKLRR